MKNWRQILSWRIQKPVLGDRVEITKDTEYPFPEYLAWTMPAGTTGIFVDMESWSGSMDYAIVYCDYFPGEESPGKKWPNRGYRTDGFRVMYDDLVKLT
jgi:hypothetical protein